MKPRVVVATLWSGARVISRLGPDDPDPSPAELDELAVAWTPWNDGVKPTVRLVESMPSSRRRSPAGRML